MSFLAPGATLVLASGSAARAACLRGAGLDFTVSVPAVDEAAIKTDSRRTGLTVQATAMLLAEAKALSVHQPDAWVIGADQILECDGAWFDKPPDLATARDHLRRLVGRSHKLWTAAVLARDARIVWRHLAAPCLAMRGVSQDWLDAYLAAEGERLRTSVGAYRIEGPGIQLFERIEGETSAILGLPLLPLLGELRRLCVIYT